MSGIQATKVIAYVTLPGIVPRVRGFFNRGFGHVAFWMACVYEMVRLLPRSHPYLDPRNIGRFGIRHVVAEAANNLVLKRQNADQIIIFVALLVAIVILFLQFLLILYGFALSLGLGFHPAHALGVSLFTTPDPVGGGTVTDIAFNLLDRVFGVPNFFCTRSGQCTTVMPGGVPWPFHVALHAMLQFYSLGLLLVGVLIFLYFVLVVVAETAITGHPFGNRFQNVWVPIRLVVALGLLLPLNYGLNSAQYITLYAAKFGSSFGTNAWITFNNTVSGKNGGSGSTVFPGGTAANPIGERRTLLAKPINPDVAALVQFMSIVHACVYATWKLDPDLSEPPASDIDNVNGPLPANFYVRPYFVKNAPAWAKNQDTFQEVTENTQYKDGLDFYDNGDITIRFGQRASGKQDISYLEEQEYLNEKGNVLPTCGEVKIKVGDLLNKNKGATVGGADYIQQFYFNLVKVMWFDKANVAGSPTNQELKQLSNRFVEVAKDDPGPEGQANDPPPRFWQCHIGCNTLLPACGTEACRKDTPSSDLKQKLINDFQTYLNTNTALAWDKYNTQGIDITMKTDIMNRGWAGAGIWYNIISQINGAFSEAVENVPQIVSYPKVMEDTRELRRKQDTDITGNDEFNPNFSNGSTVNLKGAQDAVTIATILSDFYKYWNNDGVNQATMDKTVTGEVFRDIMNKMFNLKGLISMRGANAETHPLALLTTLGKTLVDTAIVSLGASTLTGGIASMARELQLAGVGPAMDILSGLLQSVAFIALTAGLVLYYVLPFMPFLYFYAAVGTWIMSIFEAMVGVPLWALAHLRLDGNGLPGDSAANGYFLIFEIFLRPILSVFGLVAALVIFTAQVRALNVVWDLVVGNLSGLKGTVSEVGNIPTPRDIIDQFFYTVIYTIIVYMMATASFKLIDRIPDNILKFIGTSASSFSDINPDQTEGIARYVSQGGLTVIKDITGSVKGAGADAGKALGGILKGDQ